ncbi:hypothetical protein F4780DRAFT_280433 [Xylariomycetidae sp. FL0641]|nr:hypothetical protein F4780DRAFT_280433 [Xylariomycetidae sp. FL0641]
MRYLATSLPRYLPYLARWLRGRPDLESRGGCAIVDTHHPPPPTTNPPTHPSTQGRPSDVSVLPQTSRQGCYSTPPGPARPSVPVDQDPSPGPVSFPQVRHAWVGGLALLGPPFHPQAVDRHWLLSAFLASTLIYIILQGPHHPRSFQDRQIKRHRVVVFLLHDPSVLVYSVTRLLEPFELPTRTSLPFIITPTVQSLPSTDVHSFHLGTETTILRPTAEPTAALYSTTTTTASSTASIIN